MAKKFVFFLIVGFLFSGSVYAQTLNEIKQTEDCYAERDK